VLQTSHQSEARQRKLNFVWRKMWKVTQEHDM